MGKMKAVVRPTKPKLTNKIVKKKKSNALLPKLKKVGMENLLKKHEGESDQSDSELNVGELVVAPSANESYDQKDLSETSECEPKLKPNLITAPSLLDNVQVKDGISALFEYLQKTQKDEVQLFDSHSAVQLNITSIKVAKTPNRQAHLNLKYGLLEPESEICLIVKDGLHKKEYEDTVERYKNILQKRGITNIKEIMTLYQLKSDYGQFEMKRKLLGLYDYFLVDGTVFGYVTRFLGKIFYDKCKMPRAVNLKATSLKKHFEKILNKTSIKIHSKGDSYNVQVGHTNLGVEKIYENVIDIVEQLDNEFPGGVDNIRQIGIKTETSISVPLYVSLKHKRSIKVPVVKAKRPKNFLNVSGELSTYQNRTVTVLPSGKVIVVDEKPKKKSKQSKLADDDPSQPEEFDDIVKDFEDTLESDEELEVDEKPVTKQKGKKTKAKKSTTKLLEKTEENEENETILEQAEETYLNEYQHELSLKRKRNVSQDAKAKKAKKSAIATDEKSSKKASVKKVTVENVSDKKKKQIPSTKEAIATDEKSSKKASVKKVTVENVSDKKKKQKPSTKEGVAEIKVKSKQNKANSGVSVTRTDKKATGKKPVKEAVNGTPSKKVKGASKANKKKQNKKVAN